LPPQSANIDNDEFCPSGSPVPEIQFSEVSPAVRIIDVRSPAEFTEDHIPGARNVPLLDDEERKVTGTLYRVEGRESATRWALQRLNQRLHAFRKQLISQIPENSEPIICCARGGDRSAHVVQFLIQSGHPAKKLHGGYRTFRKSVLRQLERFDLAQLWILDGNTGVGKTDVLRQVAVRFPDRVIDLELYAGHRSSILGDLGLVPTSQKQFESMLATALTRVDGGAPWLLIEGESRKVGNRQIPAALWQRMGVAPRIELIASMERRVRWLVDEYDTGDGWDLLHERVDRLRSYSQLGDDRVDHVQRCLEQGDPESAARCLLEFHYDPRYQHGDEKTFQIRLENHGASIACDELVNQLDSTADDSEA